ncbi:MAG: PhnD/SsuA/transferrin family substrate-binding protein [Chloroflexi bacterium]|nr:PhnD/SsuA/transferrin family substrate-binding protein [Chloroflexota bacterium]
MTLLRIAAFLAPSVYPAYEAIACTIGLQLGCDVEFLTVGTHDQFNSLAPDIAFICGLPYVLMRRQAVPVEAIAAPVLKGSRYRGQPVYYSDVIVRADAPFQQFSDLRGCRWGYNEEISQSGYGITRHTLLNMGETSGFFGVLVHLGWHQRAIKAVIRGNIDAAAIDSQVLEIEFIRKPELRSELKIIAALGPSTIQPVVVNSELPKDLKQAIQQIFLSLGADPELRPVLDAALFERFVAVDDSTYDDIRAMLEAAEEANFLVLQPTV